MLEVIQIEVCHGIGIFHELKMSCVCSAYIHTYIFYLFCRLNGLQLQGTDVDLQFNSNNNLMTFIILNRKK